MWLSLWIALLYYSMTSLVLNIFIYTFKCIVHVVTGRYWSKGSIHKNVIWKWTVERTEDQTWWWHWNDDMVVGGGGVLAKRAHISHVLQIECAICGSSSILSERPGSTVVKWSPHILGVVDWNLQKCLTSHHGSLGLY